MVLQGNKNPAMEENYFLIQTEQPMGLLVRKWSQFGKQVEISLLLLIEEYYFRTEEVKLLCAL